MKTISIISQKGGAGKTTLAINLAGAAGALGHTAVIIDLDPQASAKGWHDHRKRDAPAVISAQASRLDEILATAREHKADLCIIDTAPHSETTILTAARVSDLILIPCRPGVLDLRAIKNSVDLVQIAKRPALVVLNTVPPRGKLADEAEEAIRPYGVDVAKARITERVAFKHSLTEGKTVLEYEPDGLAAQEIKQLYMSTCHHVNMLTPAIRRKAAGRN